MSFYNVRLEDWIDQRAVGKIRSMMASGELAKDFLFESSAVYRLPLPNDASIKLGLEETDQWFSFKRSWMEFLGLGCRAYLIDALPMALFDRPLALLVLRSFGSEPAFVVVGTGNIAVNGRGFPLFNAGLLEENAIHNRQLLTKLRRSSFSEQVWPVAATRSLLGPPLHGPWPSADVPVPTTDPTSGGYVPTAPPIPAPGEADPTFLFYGMCFQGYSEIDSVTRTRIDPLWDETLRVSGGFEQRGYRARCSYAGGIGFDNALRVDTFDMMVQSLDRDVPQTFCNSPNDQMVIYVAAHGYRGQSNPTGQIALEWETESRRTKEWITHPSFWQRLSQNSAVIRNHPEKVFVLVESCRSGALFAAKPAEFADSSLFTTTPDGNDLCLPNQFSHCIRTSISNPRVDTWQKFIEAVKHCLRASGASVQPRNG